jgi:hypothetical protein
MALNVKSSGVLMIPDFVEVSPSASRSTNIETISKSRFARRRF